MALSDSCFDFLAEIRAATCDADRREAVRDLQRAVDHYAEPPFRYGDELGMLREACSTYLLSETPAPGAVDEPLRRIAFICEAVLEYLDTPPGAKREGAPA